MEARVRRRSHEPRRDETYLLDHDDGNGVEVLAEVGVEHLRDPKDLLALVVDLDARNVSAGRDATDKRQLTRRDLPSM